jgi:hypothetical protein
VGGDRPCPSTMGSPFPQLAGLAGSTRSGPGSRPIQATDAGGGPVKEHDNFAACGGSDARVECVVDDVLDGLLRMLLAPRRG